MKRPLVGDMQGKSRLPHRFRRNNSALIGAVIVIAFAVMAVLAPWLSPYDPLTRFDPPPGLHNPLPPLAEDETGHQFLLGTDKFGRDILSRALYGVRALLLLGSGSVLVAFILGVAVGGTAGYLGGSWVDELIMRGVDIMLAFPTLILILALLGAFGTGPIRVGPVILGNLAKVILIIGFTYSPRLARLTRAMVLKEMAEEYVMAARAIGSSSLRVLFRQVLPNALPPLLVQASLMMASAVLAGASLSFLGLGLQPPRPSLGLMLSEARDYLFWGAWWYMLVPGGLITLAVLGFNLLGDGLRDVLDPRKMR